MQESVSTILNDAIAAIGVDVPTSYVGNTDLRAIQSLALLKEAGLELLRAFPWEFLTKSLVITTASGIDNYTLPTDYEYLVMQSQWDRTNHWPLLGPKSAQEWAWLKGGLISQGPRARYRIYNGLFWLHPVPNSVVTVAMDYISNIWLNNGSFSIASDSDIPFFDSRLLKKLFKIKYRQAKGLDATLDIKEFQSLMSSISGNSLSAPKLSLSPRVSPILIGPYNVPDGSWQVN